MMCCRHCGVDLIAGAAFCPSCGRSVELASQASLTQPSLATNVAGLLCYLGGALTGILFCLIEPYRYDRCVRFHALQSIYLSVAWLGIYLVCGWLLALLPGVLRGFVWIAEAGIGLGFLLLWILVMVKAYNNERFKLPIIGDLAAKQA